MAIPAIPYPIYQPAMRIIASISQAFPALVTTTFDHQYVTGEIVRLVIPPGFGMQQINQQVAPITVTGSTTFTVPIDSTLFDPFSAPSTSPQNKQYAQVIPIGERNEQLNAAVSNVLPYNAV